MNVLRVRVAHKLLLSLAIAFFLSSSSSARADDAASLYKAKCAGLPWPPMGPGRPSAQAGRARLRIGRRAKNADAELTEIITNGKNKMPAYAKTLKPDDVKGLVAFIRSLAAKK